MCGITLQWRHNGCDSFSNHQPHDCLLNFLFRRRSKKTQRLRVTGICTGNSPGTGEFPAQMASNEENVSIWRRHHESGHFALKVWWLSADTAYPSKLGSIYICIYIYNIHTYIYINIYIQDRHLKSSGYHTKQCSFNLFIHNSPYS